MIISIQARPTSEQRASWPLKCADLRSYFNLKCPSAAAVGRVSSRLPSIPVRTFCRGSCCLDTNVSAVHRLDEPIIQALLQVDMSFQRLNPIT